MSVEEKIPPDVVKVAVVTTAGSYPADGFIEEPVSQKVEKILKQAADALHLTTNSDWVAKVNGDKIHEHKTYAENGLSGKVEIDWGPREGGGGSR